MADCLKAANRNLSGHPLSEARYSHGQNRAGTRLFGFVGAGSEVYLPGGEPVPAGVFSCLGVSGVAKVLWGVGRFPCPDVLIVSSFA